MLSTKIHSIAKEGFNKDAQLYDEARPNFPAVALPILIPHSSGLNSYSPVLELGSGTGKFTALISSQFNLITAVDPASAMRDVFAQNFPQFTCLEGSAYNIPVASGSQKAVYIAQAFHWFANIEALREIHRVLAPGGLLTLIWNMEDDKKDWVKNIRDIYQNYEEDTPQYRLGLWKNVFEGESGKEVGSLFTLPLKHTVIEHSMKVKDFESIWKRALTKSYMAVKNSSEQESIKKDIFAVLQASESSIVLDEDGMIVYPYVTEVFQCHKI
ncbi:hypothetical protein HK096_010546 [Nowakowskiella sp. JEL0078]|nr:hypothetical protein HK096_010546 [Nowakowskiella sp. JEL0078]